MKRLALWMFTVTDVLWRSSCERPTGGRTGGGSVKPAEKVVAVEAGYSGDRIGEEVGYYTVLFAK